jgi:hypothetical protein
MILIEYYPCKNNLEATAREQYYTELLNSDMNSNVPGALNHIGQVKYNKQYYDLNKEKISEQKKQYRGLNKENILEKGKRYRDLNKQKINAKCSCECGGKYTYVNKIPHFNTIKHQKYMEANYEWTYWWGDIQCTLEDYNICHYV